MTMVINVPGIASGGVDWPVLPVVSSDFPLNGLASYLAVQGAPLDTGGNVSEMSRWYGADRLVQPSLSPAPSIVDVGGVDLLRFTRASSTRLVSPPAPAGGAWSDSSSAGFSVVLPMMLRDVATSLQGIGRFFGIGVRLVVSGGSLLQVGEIDGTAVSANVAWDFTELAVLGIAFDATTPNMKVYRNGVQVINSSAAGWSQGVSQAAALGAFFTGSDFGDLDCGDLARWTRQIDADEMLAASQFMMTRFGIS